MSNLTMQDFINEITPNEGFVNQYSLTDITECVMNDGVAWIGTIRLNNVPVGSVECHGDGGCYSYYFDASEERKNFMQAVTDAYYMRDMIDVEEDSFINFLDLENK